MGRVLQPEAVRLDYRATDWRDAVSQSGALLEQAGLAAPEYTQAMIRMVETYGAYILVAPGVAVPHARTENGATGTGISLLRLAEAVTFPQRPEEPVRVLVGVAAADREAHLETFGKVAERLLDPGWVASLLACRTAADAVALFDE